MDREARQARRGREQNGKQLILKTAVDRDTAFAWTIHLDQISVEEAASFVEGVRLMLVELVD